MLQYPIVIYIDGNFIVANDAWRKAVSAKVGNQGRFSMIENRKRKMRSGWLLDVNGGFYHLEAFGKTSEWLRPLALLWNFVRSEYVMSGPQQKTVGEIKDLLSMFSNSLCKNSQVKDFKTFLGSLPSEEKITREVLAKWPI